MSETTKQLAKFSVASVLHLPDKVRHEGRRALVNWLGCALGGAYLPASEIALATAAPYSSDGATLIGRRERLGALDAAFFNCLTSSANAFDDTHLATVVHPLSLIHI